MDDKKFEDSHIVPVDAGAAEESAPVKRRGGRQKGKVYPYTGSIKTPRIDKEIAKYSTKDDPIQTVLDNMDESGNISQTSLTKTKKGKHRGRNFVNDPFPVGNVSNTENAKTIRLALASLDLPPIDLSDQRQVSKRITEYLEFCEQYDRMPSMIGMANWLGVSKQTVGNWKRGDFRADTHTPIIQKACSIMEEMLVEYNQQGRMHPAVGIFLLKNMFQYKDVQDVVVTPKNPLGDAEQQGQLEDKYLDIVEIPDDGD